MNELRISNLEKLNSVLSKISSICISSDKNGRKMLFSTNKNNSFNIKFNKLLGK